jgi:hypothetical protein
MAINWQETTLAGSLAIAETTDARSRSDEIGHPLGEARSLAPGTYVVTTELRGATILKPTESGNIGSVGSRYYGLEVDGETVFVQAGHGMFSAAAS